MGVDLGRGLTLEVLEQVFEALLKKTRQTHGHYEDLVRSKEEE